MLNTLLQQNFEPSVNVKILINVGACFDIPTGTFVKGKYGESLLLAGLGWLTGIVGGGKKFKSTIEHYQTLSAADRIASTSDTSIGTYDTETNTHHHRLVKMSQKFESFKNIDIISDGKWVITDKTVYYGDKWFEILKDFTNKKIENKKSLMVETPFLDRTGKDNLKILLPTFSEIDSISEFETSDIAKIQDENLLGESGGNTIHMRQGLAKTRMLMEIPTIAGSANHFFLITAHLGKDLQVASGPYSAPPEKKLQHMKMGDKIKGVTDKFFFLMSNCWWASSAAVLFNQSTKAPEYPRDPQENKDSGSTDLNIVSLKQLRSKSGPSGYTLEIIVSQSEGVLPSLTEFHYIKNSDRFGLEGSLVDYKLSLLPDVSLSRTTVRGKIDSNKKLRRALNITSELCQMHEFYRGLKEGVLCTPKELYEGIKEKGYNWDFILENTRGWWTVNNDKHHEYFLSTMDLCLMRIGDYHPYWLEDDKVTIKKQFLNKK